MLAKEQRALTTPSPRTSAHSEHRLRVGYPLRSSTTLRLRVMRLTTVRFQAIALGDRSSRSHKRVHFGSVPEVRRVRIGHPTQIAPHVSTGQVPSSRSHNTVRLEMARPSTVVCYQRVQGSGRQANNALKQTGQQASRVDHGSPSLAYAGMSSLPFRRTMVGRGIGPPPGPQLSLSR